MSFLFNLIDSFSFLSFLPELFLMALILCLIFIAVSTAKDQKIYLLNSFLNFSVYFYFLLIIYLIFLSFCDLYQSQFTFFFFYDTLKLNQILIFMKILLSFFSLGCLISVKRYLLLFQLPGYEYPLLITLGTLSMFFAISANNWILLFLALEFQALCFLVLFAWNRRSEKAINATLKFSVINFVASTLVLLAFIQIILMTQTINIALSNPFVLAKSFLQSVFNNMNFLPFTNLYNNYLLSVFDFKMAWYLYENTSVMLNLTVHTNGFLYDSLWAFSGLLLILGFSIKLGLVPFGFWLQDLYTCISLPVLTFFSTAPKLTYLVILLSLYLNLYSIVNPEGFLFFFFLLGTFTLIVGNLLMFSVRNNLLILLAWSSIANMGLLFFLFGQYPLQAYTLVFIILYTISTFSFFFLLQYFVMVENKNSLVRHVIYFSDLSVIRYQNGARLLFLVLILSFLNFFGIPPFLNFWMKYNLLQGLVINIVDTYQWFFLINFVFITIIGSFTYLRILYTLVTENQYLGLNFSYWPMTKTDSIFILFYFFFFQIFNFFFFSYLESIFFSADSLLCV